MRKKWLFSAIIGLSIFSQISFAEYITLYETTSESVELASGVTQTQIQRFTDGGWLNINVIKVDLTQGSEMTVVTDDYLSSRDALSKLVAQSDEADQIVAAINSDFFDTANNTTMGTLIKEGQVLTSGIGYDDFASFNIADNGLPFIAYINHPTNVVTDGERSITLSYINKPYLGYDRIIMYDSTWASQSYGNTYGQDIYEVLVVDGVVKDYRTNGAPFDIPDNGYVLSAVGKGITTLKNAFPRGDKLSVSYDINYSLIDLAIGGGAQIVSGGKVPTTFSSNITGNNPRTALGIDKARKVLYLVTVDGRTSSYRGVTQTELANIMISLGSYEAINLDGGGSSEMLVKNPFETSLSVANNLSDGSERKMYTGLAVVKEILANPVLKEIQIETSKERYLLGESIDMSLEAIDSNYNLTDPDQGSISWSFAGASGSFENGYFNASEAGNLEITVEYQGMTARKTLEIFDDSTKLIVSPSTIKIASGNQTSLKFSVVTEEGETVTVSPASVCVSVPSSLGTYDQETGIFTSNANVEEGYITASMRGLTTYIPVAVGTTQVSIEDFESGGMHFVAYPATVTGQYTKTVSAQSGSYGGLLQYDFSNSTDTRAAYIVFDQALKLPDGATSLGLWVYGDGGNDHWLRAKITDALGSTTNITFAQHVDWSGWKYVTATLPASYVQPISLDRIYLVETDATKLDSGVILVDNLTATVSQADTITVPENITRIATPESYLLPSDVTYRKTYAYLTSAVEAVKTQATSDSIGNISVSGYSFTKANGYYTMTLNNANNSIRKNGYTQWTSLLNDVKKIESEPLVIFLSDTNTFVDALEGNLFYETLGQLVDKGVDVLVVGPSATEFTLSKKEGVRVLGLPKSTEVLKGLTLGLKGSDLYFQIRQ